MRHYFKLGLITSVLLATAALPASAQSWGRGRTPSSGVCFYEDINFSGRYFCGGVGASSSHVSGSVDDEISSIRIFGEAEVVVFRDSSFNGDSRLFNRDVRDLRSSGLNDRITSYRVTRRGYGNHYGGGAYGGGYGGGAYARPGYDDDDYRESGMWRRDPNPSSGACFYEDSNFRGRYFCSRIGSDMRTVPYGSNDEISSIRLFGNAEVTLYRDSNYRGQSRRFSSDVRDLNSSGFNDRLSSFQIRARAYGRDDWNNGYGGGAYGGGSYGGRNGQWSGESRYTYQQAEAIVQRAYRNVFRRDPDPASRPWVNEVMKNNMSQSQLEAELRKSPEYRNRDR